MAECNNTDSFTEEGGVCLLLKDVGVQLLIVIFWKRDFFLTKRILQSKFVSI